tara:strand:- start:10285 stop:10449 length:165 start_codon:yes stop_codon:yes gene_type:complete
MAKNLQGSLPAISPPCVVAANTAFLNGSDQTTYLRNSPMGWDKREMGDEHVGKL